MATATNPRAKLLTLPQRYDTMSRAMGRYPGLVALEQAMFQSEKHKVCIECLTKDNLVHITSRALIKSTDYYMCQECIDYWNQKG